tara:strand:- start:446 stop:649 length:204 start_codon:yes stop_codon:yes gene_type:complete
MNGKGSRQRDVDKKKFDSNWDEIFGKKNSLDELKVRAFKNPEVLSEYQKLEFVEEECLKEFTELDQK